MNKNRVEAFSDGVFAIVITLLILDIRVPDVDYSQLLASLVAVLPRIFAYVISFAVRGTWKGRNVSKPWRIHNDIHLLLAATRSVS